LEDGGPNAFSGSVDVSSNKTCSAGCVESAAFTNGLLASHSLTLTQAGSAALVKVVNHGGVYGTDPSGVSASFTVNPAATHDLIVANFADPTTAGVQHSFDVTAEDAFGNVTPAYTGTAHFASNDGQAVLPADYTSWPATAAPTASTPP